jgi:hypothetical protein
VESRWYEVSLYEFTLEREVSKETVKGHFWEWNEGNAVVYRFTDGNWARATVYPFDNTDMAMKAIFGTSNLRRDQRVEKISGVTNVEKEVLGRTEWDISVVLATGKIINVRSEDILDGNPESEHMERVSDKHNWS